MHPSTETLSQPGLMLCGRQPASPVPIAPSPHHSQPTAAALSLWQYTGKTGGPQMASRSECGVTTHITHLRHSVLDQDN